MFVNSSSMAKSTGDSSAASTPCSAKKADVNDPLFRLVCDAPARRPALATEQRQPLWTTCNSTASTDHARAIEACSAFIEAAGEEPATLAQVFTARAKQRYNTNEKDGAIGDLTRAIRFAPDTAGPYKTRSLFLFYGRHDSKKALDDINRALAMAPDADGFFIRSVIYREGLFDFTRSLADLDEALRLAPRDWQSLQNRCWVRAILNRDLDKAEADCRASLELFPRWNRTYDALGLVNLKRGNLQEALANYDTAVNGDPDLMSPLYGRGIVKLRLGQISDGQADIAAATARSPDLAAEYARYGIKP